MLLYFFESNKRISLCKYSQIWLQYNTCVFIHWVQTSTYWWFKRSSKIRICSKWVKLFFKKCAQLSTAHTYGFSWQLIDTRILETQSRLSSTDDFFLWENHGQWVRGVQAGGGLTVLGLPTDTLWNNDYPPRSEQWRQTRSLPKAVLNFSVIYVLGSPLNSDLKMQNIYTVR